MFKAPLVRAILNGQKTQTRRLFRQQPEADQRPELCVTESGHHFAFDQNADSDARRNAWKNPRPLRWEPNPGQPRSRIYVRETWAAFDADWKHPGKPHDLRDGPWPNMAYAASSILPAGTVRPAVHMPRWAARVWLEITGVRVERLQQITDADALAEGVDRTNTSIAGYARERFKNLWETTGGNWDENPWLWVTEFRVLSKVGEHGIV